VVRCYLEEISVHNLIQVMHPTLEAPHFAAPKGTMGGKVKGKEGGTMGSASAMVQRRNDKKKIVGGVEKGVQ